MLRVNECHLGLDDDCSKLKSVIQKKLKTKDDFTYEIIRESLDARKKQIVKTYSVDVTIEHEEKYLHLKDVTVSKTVHYQNPSYASFEKRPVVIGMGPSGLYCALLLAECNARPIVFERGSMVEKRLKDIELFSKTGILNENSNVQFGEGGAGTFSDGKLTSRSKDPRSHKVLEEFVTFGADPKILYEAYPHIGSDQLAEIIPRMRQRILDLGGEIYFDHTLEDIHIEKDVITRIQVNGQWMPCDDLLLGIGHSARDTFHMLADHHVMCEPKNFAVGVRIEHEQTFINQQQYGEFAEKLPPASYRLTHTTKKGRGVYTFCMCPGGEVVMATSKKEHLVVNGMSLHARDGKNANSALLVQIRKEDVGEELFDGMDFQESLEKKAFELGGKNYYAPVQKVQDYLCHQKSTSLGNIKPTYALGTTCCDLHDLFPDFINEALEEGLCAFDSKMKGFAQGDALLCGVESRSTSPIRIVRNNELTSVNIQNLYPMGEGAGYAGGIVSAAIDGLKCAEEWMRRRGKK